jgi:hypothetical protein
MNNKENLQKVLFAQEKNEGEFETESLCCIKAVFSI